MNPEKLKKLEALVRIGGKGTPRRKKKITHTSAHSDDKKIQIAIKKCGLSPIPGAEEANIFKDDGTVVHFKFPSAQGSMQANMLVIVGHTENKTICSMFPDILPQLGPKNLKHIDTGRERAAIKFNKTKTETANANANLTADNQESTNIATKDSDNILTFLGESDVAGDTTISYGTDDEDVLQLVDNFEISAFNESSDV